MRVTGVSQKQFKTIHWHTATIVVKQILPIDEYIETIHKIITDCRTKEDNVAVELLDFSIRANIVSSYAFIELPDDIEELYYVLYASDLYNVICSNINRCQVDSIINTVRTILNFGGDN